jgi:predicted AAA+ superfamily ATPase
VIFIADKGGEKMYVQVALSILEPDTMNREFGNLMNIPDNYPKKVVSMQAFSGNTVNGIETQDLRSFLMT